MISDKTIRSKRFYGAFYSLKEELDKIATTREQRDRVERLVGAMEEVFVEANEIADED